MLGWKVPRSCIKSLPEFSRLYQHFMRFMVVFVLLLKLFFLSLCRSGSKTAEHERSGSAAGQRPSPLPLRVVLEPTPSSSPPTSEGRQLGDLLGALHRLCSKVLKGCLTASFCWSYSIYDGELWESCLIQTAINSHFMTETFCSFKLFWISM